jgi:N utilization substance protein B
MRRKAREQVLKLLYQLELSGPESESGLAALFEPDKNQPPDVVFARDLFNGVVDNKDKIDGMLKEHSIHWQLGRMAAIDRNILRLATFELIFRADIPAKVAINEAVELAKKYGSQDSPDFVNAVLDNIRSHHRDAL